MTHDTMYLVCYANTAKTQLVKANIITAKEFSDVPMSKKTDAIAKKLSTLSEYNLNAFIFQHAVTGDVVKPGYMLLCCPIWTILISVLRGNLPTQTAKTAS